MKNELLNGINKWVIYCRVSTLNQVVEGSGLETQESICRQWAARNNLHVERVFSDAGKSGGKLDGRDALAGMVSVLERAKERHVVLFFDCSFWPDTTANVWRNLWTARNKSSVFSDFNTRLPSTCFR